jgi:hypothetical protein
MLIAALFSTAFGVFLLAFACFEFWMGDLECAASTSVLSGFFIGSGVLLFVVRRRQRARFVRQPGSDSVRLGRQLSRKPLSSDVVPFAPRVVSSELPDFDRSQSSNNHGDELEQVTDLRAIGKRPCVRKLIDELRNQRPRRQK